MSYKLNILDAVHTNEWLSVELNINIIMSGHSIDNCL